ncbi:MAG: transposase [Planctomycetota bacterium]
MAKTLGYMITWTTYGTWLQGNERGYVKNGHTYRGNKALMQRNRELQSQDMVRLSRNQQQVVRKAITEEAELQGQRIYALSVQSNHVHIVAEYTRQPISKIVAYYKKSARLALKVAGHNGKLWTKGYDKRYCFDKASLEQRIKYVQDHNK